MSFIALLVRRVGVGEHTLSSSITSLGIYLRQLCLASHINTTDHTSLIKFSQH